MKLKLATEPAILQEPLMREYSLSINGVIEIMTHINDETFFDGLFDTMIEYVEGRHGFAGLTMSHNQIAPHQFSLRQ